MNVQWHHPYATKHTTTRHFDSFKCLTLANLSEWLGHHVYLIAKMRAHILDDVSCKRVNNMFLLYPSVTALIDCLQENFLNDKPRVNLKRII